MVSLRVWPAETGEVSRDHLGRRADFLIPEPVQARMAAVRPTIFYLADGSPVCRSGRAGTDGASDHTPLLCVVAGSETILRRSARRSPERRLQRHSNDDREESAPKFIRHRNDVANTNSPVRASMKTTSSLLMSRQARDREWAGSSRQSGAVGLGEKSNQAPGAGGIGMRRQACGPRLSSEPPRARRRGPSP